MEEIVARPEKVLARLRIACRLHRRALAAGASGVLAGAVTIAVVFWAPIERATLLVQLLSSVLAAVVTSALTEYWGRRRASR